MHRVPAVTAALVAALALVACGGGNDNNLTEGDYRLQAQRVSDSFEQSFVPALEKSKSDDPQESLTGVKEIGSSADEAAQEIDKLEPPASFKDAHDKLTRTLVTVGDRADAFERAIAAKDRAQADRTQSSLQQSIVELDQVGTEFDQKVGTK